MDCAPVRADSHNPRALASSLTTIQVDKSCSISHDVTGYFMLKIGYLRIAVQVRLLYYYCLFVA